jgi:hypothetical protein
MRRGGGSVEEATRVEEAKIVTDAEKVVSFD